MWYIDTNQKQIAIISLAQTVTSDTPIPVEIKKQMFYLVLLHSNSQIFIFFMLANRHIACPLFTCFYLFPVMTSTCFEIAKIYLRHRLRFNKSEEINWNRGNTCLLYLHLPLNCFISSTYDKLKSNGKTWWLDTFPTSYAYQTQRIQILQIKLVLIQKPKYKDNRKRCMKW